MFENNWKTWVVMTLLAVGISFEIIKHMPDEGNLAWAPENLHLTAEVPYSIHFKKSRHTQNRVAALGKPSAPSDVKVLQQELVKFTDATKPMATTAEKKADDPKAKKKKKKKKDDDEFETVIDPVTGKKVRRKKKTDGTVDPAPPSQLVNFDPLPPLPVAQPDGTTPINPAPPTEAPGQVPGGIVSNPQTFNTLQEWERLLLGTPSTTETQTFIKDYQQHLVTSEVFYEIVNMMIADPRPAMEQLGVYCAASTTSAESFQILAQTESNNNLSAAVKTSASQDITTYYSSTSSLPILQAALQSSTAGTQLVAAQQVDAIVKRALSGVTSPTANPSASAAGGISSTEIQQLLTQIQKLTASPNATLSAEAQTTSADLQSLLAQSGGAVNSPVASTP